MGVSLSIITNSGALAALQQLSKTQKALNITQLRVTTGLKVNGPQDDPSSFAIAQRLCGAKSPASRPSESRWPMAIRSSIRPSRRARRSPIF